MTEFRRRIITKLTNQEEKFVQQYLINKDSVKAFLAAGYKDPGEIGKIKEMAAKIFNKPKVQDRIRELQDAQAAKMGVTVQSITENFVAVFEKAMSAQKPDFTNANRALENLARYLGMEVHKSEITQHILSGHEDEDSIDKKIRQMADVAGVEIVLPPRRKVEDEDPETVH